MLRFLALSAIAFSIASPANAGSVASAKSFGYRNKDAAKYERLVVKYAKKPCNWVSKENRKAQKIAGKKTKGTGLQIAGAVLNQGGGSGGGLLAQVGGNVVKDAALRRDASKAVLAAKACK